MDALDDVIHQQITQHCEAGNIFSDQGNHPAALESYAAAWDLLPEPKTKWEAATWILTALGDTHFLTGDFIEGRNALLTAMHCPDAIGNPFIHLRLGQCQFELGDLVKAGDELTRAYMGAGGEIFQGEAPKYYTYLKSILKEPSGGWDRV